MKFEGAYETICDGVISMVSSGTSLDTNFLCSITLNDVSTHFGIPIQQQLKSNPNKRNELTSQFSSLHQLVVLLQKVSAFFLLITFIEIIQSINFLAEVMDWYHRQ
jgi:hypothetical protein